MAQTDRSIAESAERAATRANRRRRVRRNLGIATATLAILAALGTVAGWPAWLRASDTRDTDARVAAITAYMKPIEAATHGQLKLDTYGDSKGVADRTGDRAYFYVVVGNCPAVDAYVTSPRRPKANDKLGPLHVVIPGTNPDAATSQPIIDWQNKDWIKPFLRPGSGLKHCLAS